MLIDSTLQFSAAQEVTAAAASANVIDIGSARDIGAGEDLFLVCICTVAMTDDGGNSTLDVLLRTDDNVNAGALAAANNLATMFTFPAGTAAGTKKTYRLPPGLGYQRYLDVYYSPNNGNLTTGTFNTFITRNVDAQTSYPVGSTIL